nr:hypothetical protein BaRGS_007989 [Batillaria attramentaria]
MYRWFAGMTELDNGRLLVFRVTPEINTRAFDTYTARGHNDDDNPFVYTRPNCGCMSTENYRPCDRHYRSRFLDYWPSYLIDTWSKLQHLGSSSDW